MKSHGQQSGVMEAKADNRSQVKTLVKLAARNTRMLMAAVNIYIKIIIIIK